MYTVLFYIKGSVYKSFTVIMIVGSKPKTELIHSLNSISPVVTTSTRIFFNILSNRIYYFLGYGGHIGLRSEPNDKSFFFQTIHRTFLYIRFNWSKGPGCQKDYGHEWPSDHKSNTITTHMGSCPIAHLKW